ncbi:hypothetical protein [Aeromonas phage phiWae14]|nr:hypothetical protein [Aeromonas phage phiWae14]
MAERIPLVIQPPKTTVPKVWENGAWVDAVNTKVVVRDANNKIPVADIPEEAVIANAPAWIQAKSWKIGSLVYANGQVYRANDNIEANTPFTIGTGGATWRLV